MSVRDQETYITRVKHSRILPSDFGEGVPLITQQAVHVPDEAQVLLVPARLANRTAPFFDSLEDLELNAGRADRGSLGKAAYQLIEELLGADLEVEGVTAVLDANVEKVEGEQGHVGVSVVDVVDNGHGGFSRSGTLLGIDQVGDLEVQGQVGLVVVGAAGGRDEALKLGRGRAAHLGEPVARGIAGRCRLHVAGVLGESEGVGSLRRLT